MMACFRVIMESHLIFTSCPERGCDCAPQFTDEEFTGNRRAVRHSRSHGWQKAKWIRTQVCLIPALPRTGGEADVGSNAVLATECFGRLGKSPRLRIHIYTRKPILSAPQDCCLGGPKFFLPLREPRHTVDALEPAGEGNCKVVSLQTCFCEFSFGQLT